MMAERNENTEAPASLGCHQGHLMIGQEKVAIDAVLASRETRRRWLADAHRTSDPVRCLCVEPPIAMGVKCYMPHGTYTIYHLARNDPARHAPGCLFHFVPGSRSSRCVSLHNQTASVLTTHDGVQIRPSWALRDRSTDSRQPCRIQIDLGWSAGCRVSSNRASLRTLLEVLWQRAGLCYWHPSLTGRRPYATVVARLMRAARAVSLDAYHLAPLLYIPPPYHPDRKRQIQAHYAAWWSQVTDRSLLRYVLGAWRGLRIQGERTHILLRHTQLTLPLPTAQWSRVARLLRLPDRSCDADAQLGWPPPIVWLAAVRCERQDIAVQVLAALPVADCDNWIPCESDYERQLIKRLVADRRIFAKPLQAGQASEIRPDIVLLDRRDRCYLEVLGRWSDRRYIERWRRKSVQYARRQQAYWTWTPATQPAIPPLPPAEVGKATVTQPS